MMKQILILVEGQTEEQFIKNIFSPYLNKFDVHLNPTIINTKLVKGGKNFKGGIDNYGQIKRDILHLTRNNSLYVTTFLDFYALPDDFPEKEKSKVRATSIEKVKFLENTFYKDINKVNFIPYLQLHEFEAILFADIKGFEYCFEYNVVRGIAQIIQQFPNPEDINDNPYTAPSKRILNVIPQYNKPFQGNLIALENGIDVVLSKCPHFLEWTEKLKSLG